MRPTPTGFLGRFRPNRIQTIKLGFRYCLSKVWSNDFNYLRSSRRGNADSVDFAQTTSRTYEFYPPNEKEYQMKSDKIGMPLPRNHGKSVENNIPLELFLHVSLHVIVRSIMQCGSAW